MALFYSNDIKSIYVPNEADSHSRYQTKIRLLNNKGELSIRMMRLRDLTFNDDDSVIHVVQPMEEYRPDLISYQYFGTPDYAWAILAANNLSVPFELNYGTKILIPSLASLQGANGKLVTR